MLHHGGNGDGGHDQNGGDIKLGNAAGGIGDERLEAQNGGQATEEAVHAQTGEVDHLHTGKVAAQSHQIGNDNTQQDGDDLDHAFAPDVGNHDDGDGEQSQPPAGGGIGNSGGGQIQADEDDDGAGDHGGQEVHDAMNADHLDNGSQNHVQKTGDHDAAAGVLQLFTGGHTGVDTGVHGAHGGKAAQESEGGTEEGGNLHFGAEMEEEGADTGEEEGGLNAQGQAVTLHQNGDQNGGAKHGKHVLQAQNQHSGETQSAGVTNDLLVGGFLVHKSTPF